MQLFLCSLNTKSNQNCFQKITTQKQCDKVVEQGL